MSIEIEPTNEKVVDAIAEYLDRLVGAGTLLAGTATRTMARDIEAIAAKARVEPAEAEPARVRILARKRDWNARCNGTEENRRILEPGDSMFRWAAEGQDVRGSWEGRGGLASARLCKQTVSVIVGTVVVAFDRDFRGGVARGGATVTAGVVVMGEDDKAKIEWGGLSTRGSGKTLEIKLPNGEWIYV